MQKELTNFIKYCLGYVKLTRQRTIASQQRHKADLSGDYFDLNKLLSLDIEDSNGRELINLKGFYSIDPNDVPENARVEWEKEKALANKIDEIYSKYKNSSFTKQVFINFGYFKIEIPFEPSDSTDEYDQEDVSETLLKVDKYPLFSMPVMIEKEIIGDAAKYFLVPVDTDIQINIGILENVLGENSYYQLVEEIGKYETDDKFSLPVKNQEVFDEIWHKIKAFLRLKEVNFDEKSFTFNEMKVVLSPKANYFLAEDLQRLSKLTEEDLKDTALTSWTEDDQLNIDSGVPKQTDLYFPFPYDKYQLRSLSLINNKAAIIQGPPGTGKSETIANLLCHLAANGKRVLFVSQKSQALKVVKDKLKKTGLKYLFGYVPNPRSQQLSEEDKADGVAPQLAALNSYLSKIEHQNYDHKKNISEKIAKINLESTVNKKLDLESLLQNVIESQREFYKLNEELNSLSEFNLSISNIKLFEDFFSVSVFKEIKLLNKKTDDLNQAISRYKKEGAKTKLDKQFSGLDLKNNHYSEILNEIREDVSKTAYDRKIKLFRKVNNIRRKIRLNKLLAKLPRELVEEVNHILDRDISRNKAEKEIERLYLYCDFHENQRRFHKVNIDLNKKWKQSGLSSEEFFEIEKIVHRKGNKFTTVRKKILRAKEIKVGLNKLAKSKNATNEISASIKQSEIERRNRVSQYLQNIINENLINSFNKGITVARIVKRLAKAFGKSKRAFKTFDNLRKDPENFNAVLDLIPVWIMELDDASRIIPLEASLFDYVILDEASQCNIAYTLPTMFRSKKALFVGDSEQMRDNTIIFKSNKSFDELASRYGVTDDLQIKSTGNAVQSVLDVATLRGLKSIQFHYHYRSPDELIGFSNKYFYKPKGKELISLNNSYLTFKDTDRIMLIHRVKASDDSEISDKINMVEAAKILELFKELRNDNRYKDRSIGILSFFNEQATYIRKLFEDSGFKEEDDNYKVSIVEGIQGDEKDIIIYSFVIRSTDQKNKYIPMTGEKGDIRGDINQGRVNVAFSRARLQTHCFVSMDVKDIPDGIWIKKYLNYVDEFGKVDFYSTKMKPFDSYFEEEFYNVIRKNLKQGYQIQNQVESCGFRIDFVVSNSKTGRKIAVECDGPTHFKDEIDEAYGVYVKSDEERQRVLEAAGWDFYRIKYSDWIDKGFDKKSVIYDIRQLIS